MKTAKEMNAIATTENRNTKNTRQNLAIAYVDKVLNTLINDEAVKGNYSIKIKKPECGELKMVKIYLKSNGYKVISFGNTWKITW
jgi:hypothetical protein